MDLLLVLIVAVNIVVIADILHKLRGNLERFLWAVAVLALPVFGAALWVYVQYMEPARRRRKVEERRKGGALGGRAGRQGRGGD